MKLVILSFVFTVLMVAQGEEKPCKKQDDCDDGECCASRYYFKGTCKPLAQEGEKCSYDWKLWGKYIHNCPCISGLYCEPIDKEDLGGYTVKYNQRCVSAGRTVAPTVPTGTVPE